MHHLSITNVVFVAILSIFVLVVFSTSSPSTPAPISQSTSSPVASPSQANLAETGRHARTAPHEPSLSDLVTMLSSTNVIVLTLSSFEANKEYITSELHLGEWDPRFKGESTNIDDDLMAGRRRLAKQNYKDNAKAYVSSQGDTGSNYPIDTEATSEEQLPELPEKMKLTEVLEHMAPKLRQTIEKISHPAFEAATLKLKETMSIAKDFDFSSDAIDIKFINYQLGNTMVNNKNNQNDSNDNNMESHLRLSQGLSKTEMEFMAVIFDIKHENEEKESISTMLNQLLIDKIYFETTHQAFEHEIQESIFDVFDKEINVVWIYPLYTDNGKRVTQTLINIENMATLNDDNSERNNIMKSYIDDKDNEQTNKNFATWSTNSSENIESAKTELRAKQDEMDAKHEEKLLLTQRLRAHRNDEEMIQSTIDEMNEKIDTLKVQIAGIKPVVNDLKLTKNQRESQLKLSIQATHHQEANLDQIHVSMDQITKNIKKLMLQRKIMEKELSEQENELKNLLSQFATIQKTNIIEAKTEQEIHFIRKEQILKIVETENGTILTCEIEHHKVECGQPIINCKNTLVDDHKDYEIDQSFRIHYLNINNKDSPKSFDFWVMDNDDCRNDHINDNTQLTTKQMIQENIIQPTASYHCEIDFNNDKNDSNHNILDTESIFEVECTLVKGTDDVDGDLKQVCLYVTCDRGLLDNVELGAVITVKEIDESTNEDYDDNDSDKVGTNPMESVKQEIEQQRKQAQSLQNKQEKPTKIQETKDDMKNQEPQFRRLLASDMDTIDEEGASSETVTSIITRVLGASLSVFALLISFYWLYK